jgi:hypothetical protein
MEMQGHVHNGVVVLDTGLPLPEGARVLVSVLPAAAAESTIECVPGRLPVVHGGAPGSLNLTNQRIWEILDDEDAQAIRDQLNAPS